MTILSGRHHHAVRMRPGRTDVAYHPAHPAGLWRCATCGRIIARGRVAGIFLRWAAGR